MYLLKNTFYFLFKLKLVLFLLFVSTAFENSIIEPESEEEMAGSSAATENNAHYTSGGGLSTANLSLQNESNKDMDMNNNASSTSNYPSSVEIYTKSKQRPHVLYQLFQLNSHSRPANVVLNHSTKKVTKIKKRRHNIVNLFPNHPNRTKIVRRKTIKKPKFQLPVCCDFPSASYVNDGQTYHCNNRMVDFSVKPEKVLQNSNKTLKPIWKVPGHFMNNWQDAVFALDTAPLSCGHGGWQLQGFIHIFQKNASDKHTGQMASGILSDGFLKYENEFYRPEEFCINGLSPRIIEVMMCKPNCKSNTTPCIPKCCAMDESYSLGIDTGFRGCSPLGEEEPRFNPIFFRNMHYPLKSEDQEKIRPHFIQKYPPSFKHHCYRKITLAFPYSESIAARLNSPKNDKGPTFKNLQFRFRYDGKLMYTVPEDDGNSLTAIYNKNEFCVDLVTDYGGKEPLVNHENQTILFICASQPNIEDDENY